MTASYNHPVSNTTAGMAAQAVQWTDSNEFKNAFTTNATKATMDAAKNQAAAYLQGLGKAVMAEAKDGNSNAEGDGYLSMATAVVVKLRLEHSLNQQTKAEDVRDASESAAAQADACAALARNSIASHSFKWKNIPLPSGSAYCLDLREDATPEQAVAQLNSFKKLHP